MISEQKLTKVVNLTNFDTAYIVIYFHYNICIAYVTTNLRIFQERQKTNIHT